MCMLANKMVYLVILCCAAWSAAASGVTGDGYIGLRVHVGYANG